MVAATTRTSTLTSWSAPSRENSWSWSTRRSLAWSGQGHLADLVEEQRAAVGELELARLHPVRAGERAALVAEELALEQGRRQGRAVDLDAGARAADRGVVDGARDELLAHSRFAPDENGDVGVGDLLDHLLDGLHAGTLLEDAVVIRARPLGLLPEHLLPELLHLPAQRGLLLRARDGLRRFAGRVIAADDDHVGRPIAGRTADSIASRNTWPSNGFRRQAAMPDCLTHSLVVASSRAEANVSTTQLAD